MMLLTLLIVTLIVSVSSQTIANSTTDETQCLTTCLTNALGADPNPANCGNLDTSDTAPSLSTGIEACLCTNPTFAGNVVECLKETCTTIAIDAANDIIVFCDEAASAVASSGTTSTAPTSISSGVGSLPPIIISVSSSGNGIGSGSGPAATTSTQPEQAQLSLCTTVAFVFIATALVM
ncbi:hypothetical protein EXIGLDRAFT_755461 [Exidia glandulosa HHB12029]|uniref:Extracellular membrane protein CFEM domain-containing protein n=1 Tax=Exidia glandulosa HHB12029 TaxID=1314781 RepID=A0A165C1R9_EXIGL|nr:hypothetical protein EXIGLDRAFT_755461 [Exidia glandulosa HHB12029]